MPLLSQQVQNCPRISCKRVATGCGFTKVAKIGDWDRACALNQLLFVSGMVQTFDGSVLSS